MDMTHHQVAPIDFAKVLWRVIQSQTHRLTIEFDIRVSSKNLLITNEHCIINLGFHFQRTEIAGESGKKCLHIFGNFLHS